jgi:hypothetical protein
MTQATTTTLGEIQLSGDLDGTAVSPQLKTIENLIAGEYTIPKLTVDVKGRITAIENSAYEDFYPVISATSSVAGVVKIGEGIAVTNGVISVDTSNLPSATTSSLGVVQIGTGLSVTNGIVSLNTSSLPNATISSLGVMQVGTGLSVTNGIVSLNAPNATTSSKGIIQGGANTSITNGVLDVVLPVGSSSQKGILQVGTGFSVVDGVVSVSAEDTPVATTASAGIVQIGTGLSVTSGVVSAPLATSGNLGVVKIGSGIAVSNGIISIQDGSTTQKGILQVGAGLTQGNGIIAFEPNNLPLATQTIKGVVKLGNGLRTINNALHVDPTVIPELISVGTGLSINGSGALSINMDGLPLASSSQKGLVKGPASGDLTITNGVLALGADLFRKSAVTSTTLNFSIGNYPNYPTLVSNAFNTNLLLSNMFIYDCPSGQTVTINNPTNGTSGTQFTFIIKGTNKAVNFGTAFRFRNDLTPSELATTNSFDIIVHVYCAVSNQFYCRYSKFNP